MRELSIFVDESGDFGSFEAHAPYYIVTMVLHDQRVNISENIRKLNESFKEKNRWKNFLPVLFF